MNNHFAGPAQTGAGTLRIRASCADRPGLVSALSTALSELGCNIRESSQFSTEPEGGAFFLRLVVDVRPGKADAVHARLAQLAETLDLEYQVWPAARRKRMAVLCSTSDHCVLDLLWRARNDDLAVDIPLVISNHDKLRSAAEHFGVPYHYVPADPENRKRPEAQILDLLRESAVDFVVLARYMQILTDDFLDRARVPVINIHHSLLPAFVGAQPYRRAYERGVKIIGATAHYATPELDAGPIIAQDVEHVGHTDDAATMAKRGKNIERTVLARAVELHVEDRVHVHRNRTIIHV
ncbi:formyltetrahydrofolate deformylase [Amycolatopsis jejuensis]|uniref:formyltetrahydrofolate deformylase n=1 Tax=Amycolatopsis jejuensis TaxID=330084 RepID=UPI00068C259F|nr:formyltetrahydrofolate deformylase [Amycolatopsis jejuensis]